MSFFCCTGTSRPPKPTTSEIQITSLMDFSQIQQAIKTSFVVLNLLQSQIKLNYVENYLTFNDCKQLNNQRFINKKNYVLLIFIKNNDPIDLKYLQFFKRIYIFLSQNWTIRDTKQIRSHRIGKSKFQQVYQTDKLDSVIISNLGWQSNIIFLQQFQLLNHNRLNYLFQINSKFIYSKLFAQFISFVKSYKSQTNQTQQIYKFEEQFKQNNYSNKIILKWVMNSSIFTDLLNIAKKTQYPQILGHLTLLNKALFKQINQMYQIDYTYLKQELKIDRVFIVTLLNIEQEKYINNFKNRRTNLYITFPTFVKAFTSQKLALLKKKTHPSYYIFRVYIPKKQHFQKTYNYGFHINTNQNNSKQDVIFNIGNFFQISEVSENHEITIKYGALASSQLHRLDDLLRWEGRFEQSKKLLLGHQDFIQIQKQTLETEQQLLHKLYRPNALNSILQTKIYLQPQSSLIQLTKSDNIRTSNSDKFKKMHQIIRVTQILFENKDKNFSDAVKYLSEQQVFFEKNKQSKPILYCRYLILKAKFSMELQNNDPQTAQKLFQKCAQILRDKRDYRINSCPIYRQVMKYTASLLETNGVKNQILLMSQNNNFYEQLFEGVNLSQLQTYQ